MRISASRMDQVLVIFQILVRSPVCHPHVWLPGCAAAATSDLSFGSRMPGVNLTRDGSATEMDMAEHPREIIDLLLEVILARFPRKTPATIKVLVAMHGSPPFAGTGQERQISRDSYKCMLLNGGSASSHTDEGLLYLLYF